MKKILYIVDRLKNLLIVDQIFMYLNGQIKTFCIL